MKADRNDVLKVVFPDAEPARPARLAPSRTAGPAPEAPPEAPDVRRDGDDFAFTYPTLGLGVGVSALRETGDGVHAEVSVTSGIVGALHWGSLNLASTAARETLVKKLAAAHPGTPWRAILERVCRETAEAIRRGAPVVVLEPAPATASRYLVEKLLPGGETTVVFGDGGSGKSLLALAVAVAVSTQTPLPGGLRPVGRTNVLYLDWESTEDVHAERLAGLLKGLELAAAPGIYYRPMARALADDGARLRSDISKRGIGLVVVDSFGPACGAEPETADSAIRLMNALRTFGTVTRFLVAHVSKAGADLRTGAARPFGSVYVQNLARSVWEVRRPDDEGEVLVLGLYHRKVNAGRRLPPLGLRIEFSESAIRLRAQDLAEEPDLLARTSLSFRLLQALKTGPGTVDELAEATETSQDAARKVLNRLDSRGKVIRLNEVRGRKNVWALRHD